MNDSTITIEFKHPRNVGDTIKIHQYEGVIVEPSEYMNPNDLLVKLNKPGRFGEEFVIIHTCIGEMEAVQYNSMFELMELNKEFINK